MLGVASMVGAWVWVRSRRAWLGQVLAKEATLLAINYASILSFRPSPTLSPLPSPSESPIYVRKLQLQFTVIEKITSALCGSPTRQLLISLIRDIQVEKISSCNEGIGAFQKEYWNFLPYFSLFCLGTVSPSGGVRAVRGTVRRRGLRSDRLTYKEPSKKPELPGCTTRFPAFIYPHFIQKKVLIKAGKFKMKRQQIGKESNGHISERIPED